VEVEHIPQAAVGEGGGEDGDIVFISPVEDRFLMLGMLADFLAETRDYGAGGPDEREGGGKGGFLLGEHGGEDWDDPVFEETVVVVWNH